MSIFAKLSAKRPPTSQERDLAVSGSTNGGSVWTAVLSRHESNSPDCQVWGPCPLPTAQLAKGCICRVRFGDSSSFLISLTTDSVRSPPSGITPSTVSIPARLLDLVGVPKDTKEVVVEEVAAEGGALAAHTLSELVMTVQDRYVSKRELWIFQIRFLGSVVYRGMSPPHDHLLRCSTTTVCDMTGGDGLYGIVGPQTKIIVRSHSAQIVLMVNITSELWTYDHATKEPMFRKVIQLVVDGVGASIAEGRHHHLMVILTGRWGYDGVQPTDIYETVYEGPVQCVSVKKLRSQLTEFFNGYPSKIGWTDNLFYSITHSTSPWLAPSIGSQQHVKNVTYVHDTAQCACVHSEGVLSGTPSPSSSTNLLEAINMCLSHFSKHHLDRKLNVTGTQISLITANNGFLKVDGSMERFDILQRRIQTTACGVRIISVGPKPAIATPTVIECEGTQYPAPWFPLNFYTSKHAIGLSGADESQVDQLCAALRDHADPFRSKHLFRPSPAVISLTPAASIVSKPFEVPTSGRPAKSESEIIDLAITAPRLQRVAIEAAVRPSDVKPIDNWIVQGEGVKTLHDLIGIRLSLDMQLVDNSGVAGLDSAHVAISHAATPVVTPHTSQPLSPSGVSDSAPSVASNVIPANAFGVKVQRSSMRESHIQKVLIRGEQCLWMLNRLDSGNVYVSRGDHAGLTGGETKYNQHTFAVTYTYILRRDNFSNLLRSAHRDTVVAPMVPDTRKHDVITCKHCQSISSVSSVETRRFFIPPPLPWNLLDDIISNPYIQQTLPSTVPYHQTPPPPELEGFRWKLRSSIRTGLFCLVPKDEAFFHTTNGNITALGQDVLTGAAWTPTASAITSRFLDWLRKAERLTGAKLDVPVNDKRPLGLAPTLVRDANKDWFQLQMESQFQFPRLLLVFSIEWILCHSASIDSVVSALARFATEDKFTLIRLPQAQLFPQPSPGGDERKLCFDEMPFHARVSIALPEWTARPTFYALLLTRLVEQLKLLVLFSTREDSNPEGIVIGGKSRQPVFARQSGWVLMTRDGGVLVELVSGRIDWIVNSTSLWRESSAEEYANRWLRKQQDFLIYKQIIHTSLIDTSQ